MGTDTTTDATSGHNQITLSSEEKVALLGSLRMLNTQISRKQRANLYDPLKDYLTKPIFNQIIRGTFVSVNNIRVALLLKSKMEELVAKNEIILNQ